MNELGIFGWGTLCGVLIMIWLLFLAYQDGKLMFHFHRSGWHFKKSKLKEGLT